MEMLHIIEHSLTHAILITGFIFVMMLVIEYLNIQTKGIWQKHGFKKGWKQYILAAVLGIIPGCLGAYVAVTLFSHRMMTFGALVTTMIATSGDEAFFMLAMVPKTAILIFVLLFIIGILAGFFTDKFYTPKSILNLFSEHEFPLHEQDNCNCLQKKTFIENIKNPSIPRIILVLVVIALLLSVIHGIIADHEENWIKITIIITMSFSLFILLTVPDHFLKEHLWKHVFKKHTPKIFIWTLPTLMAIHVLMEYINIKSLLSDNTLLVLMVAVLVGFIPESGPNLVFITLFSQGAIPLSILLANSISQDGHGMLPLLAESKKSFFMVKSINIIVAFIIGGIGILFGF